MFHQLSGMQAARGHSYSSIENMAHSVRENLRIDSNTAIDVHHFFEFQLDDITLNYAGMEIPLVSGVEHIATEALTRWDPDSKKMQLLLSEECYALLCCGYPRPRYTIAHELGHALLHTRELMKLAEMAIESQAALHRGRTEHPSYMDTEWQANAFAGAFLIPARGIRDLMSRLDRPVTAYELSYEYGVSEQAAAYRLDTYMRGKTGIR